MIFGQGTTEEIQTVDVNRGKAIHMKSKNYSKEDYLFSRVLSNGDFIAFTETYDENYWIIRKEGRAGLEAEHDFNKEIKVYANGEELTAEKLQQMDSSTLRVYEDFLREMSDEFSLH